MLLLAIVSASFARHNRPWHAGNGLKRKPHILRFSDARTLRPIIAGRRRKACGKSRDSKKGCPRDPAATRVALPGRLQAAVSFYVAPDGNDANPGSKERPFGSLERARDAICGLKRSGGLSPGGAQVWLRGGAYPVKQTFELTAQDSGTEQSPIAYRAVAGETPIFRGGIRVSGFRPVSDAGVLARLPQESRGKVFCADLKSLGVKSLKPLELGGFASCPRLPNASHRRVVLRRPGHDIGPLAESRIRARRRYRGARQGAGLGDCWQ